MKFAVRFLPLAALLFTSLLFAGDKKSQVPTRVVDSGSFGIFVSGQRVATEKFEIAQQGEGNFTRSELSVKGDDKPVQKAELELNANGELRHYSWNELSPGKASATVVPDNTMLIERLLASPQDKAIDQPFLLPATTAILDDYFFSQRELLAWRYLGSNCSSKPDGKIECKLAKSEFGALIPRQRASLLVSMEYMGKEQVTIRGKQVELDRFNLQGDGVDWALWLDTAHKLQRVVIAGDATEVVRD